MGAGSQPVRRPPVGRRFRSGLLTAVLLLPAALWYLVLLVAPLVIIVIFSFGTRARNGGYAPGFVLDNYVRAIQKPEPFITSLQMAFHRDSRLPARRTAAGLLPRDAGWSLEGPSDPPPGHPVLDELPDPDLCVAADPRARYRAGRHPPVDHRRRPHPDPGDADRGHDRPRLRLPAADGLPALRHARTDGPHPRRGIQGPGRGSLGDVPPGDAADRPARAGHRQHPRVHPDDGRVRHPADPRATAGPT